MRSLLVGKDWLPNIAGGMNRYFHGETYALPTVGVSGEALVSALRDGQTAPLALHAMAAEGASLSERQRGARSYMRAAMRQDFDVVHAHFALYAYPWIRDMPSAMPLVYSFQGPFAAEVAAEAKGLRTKVRILAAKHIEKAVYRRADRMITLSEAFRDIAHTDYDVSPEKLRVIPGGVDRRPYLCAPESAEARERLGWPQDKTILFTVRRLARRMGLEGLIEAMTEVSRACPNTLLFIGGKGRIADELAARIRALGLDEHVRLLGFVADDVLPLAYAAANITVVPTVALEGFGLVTVESLASGTPVMGTPVGGTREILSALGETLLFKAATPAAMADKLIAAIEGRIALPDRESCRAFSARYDWEAVVPRLRVVFEEAIAARKRVRTP